MKTWFGGRINNLLISKKIINEQLKNENPKFVNREWIDVAKSVPNHEGDIMLCIQGYYDECKIHPAPKFDYRVGSYDMSSKRFDIYDGNDMDYLSLDIMYWAEYPKLSETEFVKTMFNL